MNHDEIRAALAAATPGPLVAFRANPSADDPDRREWIGVTRDIATDYDPDVFSSRNCPPADAELYAKAPTWLAELLAEVDEAQVEAMYVGHDYDRRGERLWRLAALAGWTPGNEADNDATAELYVRERLAEVDGLTARAEAAEQAVQRVREFAEHGREFADRTMDDAAAHWARSAADGIIRALDGGEQ